MFKEIYPFSDTDEKRWKARLDFMGMFWKTTLSKGGFFSGYIHRRGGMLASKGTGKTIGEAICSASSGQNIDWDSVDRKMTDQAWKAIAHL